MARKKSVRISSWADRDIEERSAYLETTGGLDLAIRFAGAIREQVEELQRFPELGASCRFKDVAGGVIRMKPVPGFRGFLIYYQDRPDEIFVMRVLHRLQQRKTLTGFRDP